MVYKPTYHGKGTTFRQKSTTKIAADLRVPLELKSLQSAQPGLEKKVLQASGCDPPLVVDAFFMGIYRALTNKHMGIFLVDVAGSSGYIPDK